MEVNWWLLAMKVKMQIFVNDSIAEGPKVSFLASAGAS